MGFWDTNGSPNLGQTTRPSDSQQKEKKKKKKKRTCWIVDFTVTGDHRVKESEKRDNYLDLVENWKKLWNMKVTVIPIGALGTVTKRLIRGLKNLEIRGRVETIRTTPLLRSARILRRVQETWGDLLSLKLQWETIG